MKTLFYFIFLVFILQSPLNLVAQNDSLVRIDFIKCDTIESEQLDKMVEVSLCKMKENNEPSISEAIQIVKIYMTIKVSFPKSSPKIKFSEFLELYDKDYFDKVCVTLGGCIYLRGLVLYSRKYELYIKNIIITRDKLACYNYYTVK